MQFSLPIDRYHHEVAQQVLASYELPFQTHDSAAFQKRAERAWQDLQRALTAPAQPPYRWWHRLDRAVYQRSKLELLDEPDFPEEHRLRLIQNLDHFNRLIGTYRMLQRALQEMLQQIPGERLTLLDLGSGHGMFPIEIALRRFPGKRLRVIGSDVDPLFVEESKRNAKKRGASCEFWTLDALKLDEISEPIDIITCTQTLHHLAPSLVANLIAKARSKATRGVFFFDGRRGVTPVLGASVVSFFLYRDWMTSHDGLISARRVYSPAELSFLAALSGYRDFSAVNYGPYHVLFRWLKRDVVARSHVSVGI